MRKTQTLCAVSALLGFAGFAGEFYWNPDVLTGYLHEGANWYDAGFTLGTPPASGDFASFRGTIITSPQEYAIKVIDGGWENGDGSTTYINGLPSGAKITFDATGATWYKQREADLGWANNLIFRVDNADHIFNMEGVNAGNAADYYGFSLKNGKISFTANNDGDLLNFESGTFDNAFLPDGTTPTIHSTILQHSPYRPNAVIELSGGAHKLRNVQLRGQTPNGVFRVSGGDHEIWGGLSIKCWDSTPDAVMEVTGGTVTVKDSALWVGRHKAAAGILRVKGEGVFRNSSGATYLPDIVNEQGFIEVSERGTYVSTASISAGHQTGSFGSIDVRGEGRFAVSNTLNLAEGSTSSTGRLVVAENAYAYVQNLTGAGGAERVAQVAVSDNATLEINGGTIGNNDTALVEFTVTGGNLVHVSGNDFNFGNAGLCPVNFLFEDGVVSNGEGGSGKGGWAFRGGPGSTTEFRGGTIGLGNLRVEGSLRNLPDFTNVVHQTGGEVNIRQDGWGDGLDIRGNSRNAMYLLEGGTLRVGKNGGGMLRLGHAGAANGYHAIFRQTGGTAILDGVVNMCDAGGSDGEFELLGGVCYAREIRGWNGSVYRGNTGWARCYFNGGTLKPPRNDTNLIYTMPECSVGEKGLTVDTDGLNARISAKFQNDGAGTEAEAAGLFVKAGLGTLTVRLLETDGGAKGEYAGRSLNSDHTATRVEGGTLLLTDAEDCQFGRNVTILGGATLSLAGTPNKLTVDSLTLGDGRNFAVLKLDAGDTVTVRGENGIKATCGALDVPFAGTNGSTPVFFCAGTVDPAELAKITVFNADANKEYAWETAVNEEGETVCSLVVMNRGTHSTTITHTSTGRLVEGEGAVSAVIGQVTATESEALTLARVAALDVADGQTLTLASALDGTGTELAKLGGGLLQVTGDNGGFYGSFKSSRGTLEITNRRAAGPAEIFFPLILGGGTFAYTGTDGSADFNSALRIEADAVKKTAILRTDGDLSFTAVEHVRGSFAKTGAGVLTLDLPAGQYSMGNGSADEYLENGGNVMLPVNGDSPISVSGLYGVNLFEGTLRVKGAGAEATVLSTLNTALVGGSYQGAAPAILEVSNARVNWGAGSRHAMFARDVQSAELAPKILLDNAYLWSDSMVLGESALEPIVPEITMNNSTLFDHYNAVVGNTTVRPRIVATNSKLYSDAMFGWTVRNLETARFTGPEALFGSLNVGNGDDRTGSITVPNSFDGEMRFEKGATLAVTRRLRFMNLDETRHFALVFDDATFEVRGSPVYPNDASFMGATTVNGFDIEKGGLNVSIADGYEHAITFPFRGMGDWRKTGAGTLCLTNSFSYGVGDVDVALLQTTGKSEVAEGTLLVDGGVLGSTAQFVVDADATLDLNATVVAAESLAGAGTVANGTLGVKTLVYDAEALPTFADATLSGTVNVDFGRAGDDPLDPDEATAGIVVAHYTGAAPKGFRLRAVNTGTAMPTTQFKVADGDITVSIGSSGLVLYLK